jgi:hypothetical protein
MQRARFAALTVFLLSAVGCATTGTTVEAPRSTHACAALPDTMVGGGAFDAPLTVVDVQRVYRYEGRARIRFPEGVAIKVQAEPGLSGTDVHRMVACRMERGPETRIGVTRRGGLYEVRVLSSDSSVARDIQATHTPEG